MADVFGIDGNKSMIRSESDDVTITEKAQSAFLEVAVSVVERAKQTDTPIIIYDDDRIQVVSADEFKKMSTGSAGAAKGGKE